MPIAEIHGKISRSGSNLSERMEDLLTSYVFGNSRYLPASQYLIPVLRASTKFSGDKGDIFIKSEDYKNLHVLFWRKYDESEPDVTIETDSHCIFIEAKYFSGKSGTYSGETRENDDPDYKYKDQLAREWRDLKKLSKHRRASLVYLTNDLIFPRESFKQANDELGNNEEFINNSWWLSWSKIHESLLASQKDMDQPESIIIKDILDILERKGLVRFAGFLDKFDKHVTSSQESLFYRTNLISGNYPTISFTSKKTIFYGF